MEIKVRKLREALVLLQPAIARKPNLDVLRAVLVKDGQLIGTNLTVGVAVSLPELQGSCLLPYRDVVKFLKFVPGDATLSIEAANHQVTLKMANTKATFHVKESSDDFPPLPEVTELHEPQIVDGDALVTGLLSVRNSVSNDTSRPVLQGICLECSEPAWVVATDEFRLACKEMTIGVKAGVERAIMPSEAVDALAHLWKYATKPVATIAQLAVAKRLMKLAITTQHMRAEFGNVALTIELIEGTFPAWRNMIPQKTRWTLRFHAQDMYLAVKQLQNVAEEGSSIVRLRWENSEFQVSARAEGVADVKVSVPVAVQGEEGQIAFNIRYVLDYLVGKEGLITLEGMNPTAPGVFRYGKASLYVLMPVFVR